jgi:hypothetical protein
VKGIAVSRFRLLGALALLSVLAACGPIGRTMRGYADAGSTDLAALESGFSPETPRWSRGQVRFAFDDFGTLDTDLMETYGVPWKLAAAALVQRRQEEDGAPLSEGTLRRSLAGFGFVQPRRFLNWIGPPPPRLQRPIGLLAGRASRGFPRVELEVAGIGCAACHAGVMYDARGRPTEDAWLGMPNSSLDVDAYGDSLLVALRAGVEDADRILETIRVLFPDVEEDEIATIRKHVIPRARKQIAELDAAGESPLPFTNGGPGTANGVASIQHLLSYPVAAPGRAAFTSIPFVGDRHMRSSLLADGLYAAPGADRFAARTVSDSPTAEHLDEMAGIAALFLIPAMGGTVQQARRAVAAMADVTRYLAIMEPPPFPGPIDRDLVREGRALYGARCAGCHGTTTGGIEDVRLVTFPNRLVPVREIGTDTTRLRGAENAPFDRMEGLGLTGQAVPEATGGYVAPPLTGVWATAPYLHNGSVPTLWHLMNASERPERFEVGGHALDFERMGILGKLGPDGVYRMPADYEPWSTRAVYNTLDPGKGNGGHEGPFEGLTEDQKWALMEYLKAL